MQIKAIFSSTSFLLLFIGLLLPSASIQKSLAKKSTSATNHIGQDHHCLPQCGSNGWVYEKDSNIEYKAFLFPNGTVSTYFEAIGRCYQLDGARFAVIHSADQNAFVSKFVASPYVLEEGNVDVPESTPTLFIGMHRLQAGSRVQYLNDDDTPWLFGFADQVVGPASNTTAPWLPGQPSGNATYTPSCVHMVSEDPTRNWATFSCEGRLAGYICERKCIEYRRRDCV